MPNAEKVGAVAEIAEHFTNSSAAVITEYRGLSVKQVTHLRRALGRDTTYAVVKNTLTRRAAAEAGVAIDDSLLVGPTAIASSPVTRSRRPRACAISRAPTRCSSSRAGSSTASRCRAAEIGRIADLESREVLLAKLAGALKALPTTCRRPVPGSAHPDGPARQGAGGEEAGAGRSAPRGAAARCRRRGTRRRRGGRDRRGTRRDRRGRTDRGARRSTDETPAEPAE